MKHIGIFQIYNKKFYIDIEENKLVGYYYFNEQKKYLSINEILGLVEELFNITNLQFLKEEKGYKVFKDKDTDFLRFFKDDKEDYLKFFLENGKSAILYSGNNPLTTDKHHPKIFKNKKTRNIFFLTLYSIAVINAMSRSHHILQSSDYTTQAIEFKVDIEEKKYINKKIFEEAIISSDKLNSKDKELLTNENLFRKISEVKIDYAREKSLEEKLDNIYIEEYTEEEKAVEQKKIDEGKAYSGGYYNPLVPNRLKTIDVKDESTKVHEFIHLLEEKYFYHYIVEALTEIIKDEFYQDKISNSKSTYSKEQIRTRVLMEIIDPEILWNMLFTGELEEFESTIRSLLSEEEAEKFLDTIMETLTDQTKEEQAKTNETIDNFLAVMYQNKYNDSIENDEIISMIYNKNHLVIENNRRYFNDAENKENRADFVIRDYPSIDEIIEDENIGVKIVLEYPLRTCSKEEYENGISGSNNTQYYAESRLKETTKWRNKFDNIYTNIETGEEASFNELFARGEKEFLYYKRSSKEISITEAEKLINENISHKDDTLLSLSNFSVGDGKTITVNLKNNESVDSNEIAILALKEGKYKICLFRTKDLYFPPIMMKKLFPTLLSNCSHIENPNILNNMAKKR